MRCAIHGTSINCPPFCTSQLAGTEAAGEPNGPRNTGELTSSTDVRNPDGPSDDRTAGDASKARDVGAAMSDVTAARATIARCLAELRDLDSALTYTRQRLHDCDEMLRKYDDQATAQQ